MCDNHNHICGFENGTVHTLAQLSQNVPEKSEEKNTRLQKRARDRGFTLSYIFKLIDLESPLLASYWNTYRCCNVLSKQGTKVTGKYCKNRWCVVCNHIRTAKLIEIYLPLLKAMKDPRFLTLTVPNVPEEELKPTLKRFQRFYRKLNQTASKEKLILKYLRKMECTGNYSMDNYHPHCHLIVDGKAESNYILQEWLIEFPNAVLNAQKDMPADEKSLKELFKYFTKVVQKNKRKEGKKTIETTVFNAKMMDVIFQACQNFRVFQPSGALMNKVEASESDEDKAFEELQAQEEKSLAEKPNDLYVYDPVQFDWVSFEGVKLSGYKLSNAMRELIKTISPGYNPHGLRERYDNYKKKPPDKPKEKPPDKELKINIHIGLKDCVNDFESECENIVEFEIRNKCPIVV